MTNLCEIDLVTDLSIDTWDETQKSNDFYSSDISIGESIVETIEEIIKSIPGGDEVAWIESGLVYPANFCGWGKPYLQVRLSISELAISEQKNVVFNIAKMTESSLRELIVETVKKREALKKEYIRQQKCEHAEAKLNNDLILKDEMTILEEIASLKGDALVDRLRSLGWNETWEYATLVFRHPRCFHPFGYNVENLLEYTFDYED